MGKAADMPKETTKLGKCIAGTTKDDFLSQEALIEVRSKNFMKVESYVIKNMSLYISKQLKAHKNPLMEYWI